MPERFGDVALAAYGVCASLLGPVVPLLLSARATRGKEDPARLNERYGIASVPRPDGPLVWVHAASVGETNAALPLIDRIVASGFKVVFTTATVTSARIAADRMPGDAVHQFAPLDVPRFVTRFLDRWRPDLAVFVESEIWPSTVRLLERRRIPLVVVNGRMSDRAYRRWRGLGTVSGAVFGRIGLVLARTDEDAERYRALGARTVSVSGHLKFDALPPGGSAGEREALREATAGRPVWIAASTHEGEEAIALDVHRELRATTPGLLTIVVPRHPVRGDGLRVELERAGTVAQRSRRETIAPATDLYLGDTMGEMGLFLSLAAVAFLGGSLVPIGGHNPFEPIRMGIPVVHGPHVHSFADLFAHIDEATPQARIDDAAGLAAVVGLLLSDAAERGRWAERQGAALAPLSGGLDTTMAALAPYLASGPRAA